jgi:Ureidoglycolate hydrolase
MRAIHAVPVTPENFAPYGYLANIAQPGSAYGMGSAPCVFHRDMVLVPNASPAITAFGSLKVGKREMVVEDTEYHSYAMEVMMPLDDDMVMVAGPASGGDPELELQEAFLIPQGTMVVFRAGAWHGAPYPVHHDGTVLICLPERTYLNDTRKLLLTEEQKFRVTL